ncbi:PPOX class F420-dependent oxidoreductase [Marmoricola sp. Leaf446]|uniref:PPOX class F420-dependent oxidoreductase n=1 Tax=Marmoricola sp. Leaf446 TaxID=1736379 RepID=UPI000AFADBF4|nr:PPOX class F420-dependent oxidoreductase [Marmoricola sp. Leaf446]
MTTPSTTLRELADERFVSLTTFRRTGEGVATPVWLVPDGAEGLAVWTPAGSGKVKRLRRDGRVTLRPCDRRGRVAEGAPTVEARASVSDDPTRVADVERRLRERYRWEFRVFGLVERIARRGREPERVALAIVPAA